MDPKVTLEQFQDHLAPLLDTYEQAIYLYVLRHGRLQGLDEIVIGFKSARRRMARGIAEKGTPMSETTCYEKLRSLHPLNRLAILHRDSNRCFYCLRAVDSENYVIEHVISRPIGNNSYRNVVASCIGCNNRKSDPPIEQFLRQLYREGFLNEIEFEDRTRSLQRLQAGEMKPIFP
jgi:hypothetical protein